MAEKSNRQAYLYKLLDRLKTDCDYYLGNGNFNAKHLWAGNEQGQIAEMKKIWNQLEEKPEWLTWEQILDYGAKMGVDELPSSVDGSAKETIQTMLDKKTESRDWTEEELNAASEYNKAHGRMSYEEFCKELELAKQGKSDKIKFIKHNKKTEDANNKSKTEVKIYQISDVGNCKYAFMDWDYAKDNINLEDYKEVATIELPEIDNMDEMDILEYVFMTGNSDPNYYKNNPKTRSISVSDIIELNGKKYYVDTVGFIDLTDKNFDKKTEAEIKINDEKIDLEQEKQNLKDTLKQAEEVQELKDQVEEKIDKVLNEECESNLSSQTCDDNNCSEVDSKENETQQSIANCKDCDSEMNDETNKKEESEDVNPYTGIELSDSEEAQLDTLLDRNLAEEFRALSKEEQQDYLDLVPFNKHMLSPVLIRELAEKYNLDEKILYWVVNIQRGDVSEYLKEELTDEEWENEIKQNEIIAEELPDTEYVTKILTPSDILIVDFENNLTQEQINYIESHIGKLKEVEDEFKAFGETYLNSFRQDEPIMSIKDYLIALEEEISEEADKE